MLGPKLECVSSMIGRPGSHTPATGSDGLPLAAVVPCIRDKVLPPQGSYSKFRRFLDLQVGVSRGT